MASDPQVDALSSTESLISVGSPLESTTIQSVTAIRISDPQKDQRARPRLISINTKPEQVPFKRTDSQASLVSASTLHDAELKEALTSPPVGAGVPQSAIEAVSSEVLFSPGIVEEEASRRSSSETARSSSSNLSVDWDLLAKTEEQEPRDAKTDDSTALLLARLEQANNTLDHDPKAKKPEARLRQPRPPSISHLKMLVRVPTKPELRYSMPAPPAMTDLEFYAALVADYPRTAQSLPTLLSRKIRAGIPPPLRGVVWQSMAGARDVGLEEEFDRLVNTTSPFQKLIGKDVGRSFPGVAMFQDPQGEGQLMLGRVLTAFSLFSADVGYCQGLAYITGCLVMHMGEKEAFCVLVRLMDHYNLKGCFLPELPGLHLRIYQYQKLLASHLPTLSAHLEKLNIEPLYPTQWFLSFFAVTCPLPMLLRIYDVIFAEGAAETMMRVALSLMQRNEKKILALTEFEEVMQLLVSRALWDVYQSNADDFVNDFCSLGNVVTKEGLETLEQEFNHNSDPVVKSGSTSPGLQTMASNFLGRIWPVNLTGAARSDSLEAGPSKFRPTSVLLKRTPSKQSIASTFNFSESQTDSVGGSTQTDATSVTRHGSTDALSLVSLTSAPNSASTLKRSQFEKDKDLHGQIEDLLTAFTELQRTHEIQQAILEKEREDRQEDAQSILRLLNRLKLDIASLAEDPAVEAPSIDSEIEEFGTEAVSKEDEETQEHMLDDNASTIVITERGSTLGDETLESMIERVEARFAPQDHRRSSLQSTKRTLRDDLARTKAQLADERANSERLAQQIGIHEKEVSRLNSSLRETRRHVQEAQKQRQVTEMSNRDLKSKAQASEKSSGRPESRVIGGLKEFRLGSTAQQQTFSPRSSSLMASVNRQSASFSNDTLLAELVNAKTAEAQAKQEAEEARAKLEGLRKMLGMQSPSVPSNGARIVSREGSGSESQQPTPSTGGFGRTLSKTLSLGRTTTEESQPASAGSGTPPAIAEEPAGTPAAIAAGHGPSASIGGFASRWTGWGKRSVSSVSPQPSPPPSTTSAVPPTPPVVAPTAATS